MRILFCGGGTAGHIMPAIAMADIAKEHFKDCEVAFVGRCGGEENRSITKYGHKLFTIDISGISRSVTFSNIFAIIKVIKSGRASKRIIKEYEPDIVIGTGGYVSYPVIKEAQRMKLPTVIHESNAYPGLVTRLLSPKCSEVLLNLEGAKKYLSRTDNVKTVGNPVRREFSLISRAEARRRLHISPSDFLIVSFGGSLGAQRLNEEITRLMNVYSLHTLKTRHIHATGRAYFEEVKEKYPNLANETGKCRIIPYIDDMPTWLSAADVAITRSGAVTLSEIIEAGVPAILIPSPNVTGNHQYENAKFISDGGGALMIEEKELDTDTLIRAIKKIRTDEVRRGELKDGISSFKRRATEEMIVDTISRLTS